MPAGNAERMISYIGGISEGSSALHKRCKVLH